MSFQWYVVNRKPNEYSILFEKQREKAREKEEKLYGLQNCNAFIGSMTCLKTLLKLLINSIEIKNIVASLTAE